LAVQGKLLDQQDDLAVTNVVLELSTLDEWLNINGFNVDLSQYPQTIVNYRLPDPIEVELDDNLRLKIAFGVSGPQLSYVMTGASIQQSSAFVFVSTTQRTLSSMFDLVYQLEGFLSFAVGTPVYVWEMRAKYINEDDDSPDKSVSVLYHHIGQPELVETRQPLSMLFTYNDIKGSWEHVIQTWFSRYATLKQVYQLYMSMNYRPFTFVEEEFLGWARTVEAYHRLAMNNNDMDPAEFERRRTLVIESLPESEKKVREWIKGRTMHMNEPNLERRIREILTRFNELHRYSDKQRGLAAKRLSDTRNDLTHPQNRSGRIPPGGAELHVLSEQLRFLVELCLLSEIGLDNARITELIGRQRQRRSSANWPWTPVEEATPRRRRARAAS